MTPDSSLPAERPGAVPPAPTSASDATAGHLAAYAARGAEWDRSISAAEFFGDKPDLAAYLPSLAEGPASNRGRWVLNAAIALAAALLLSLPDWKFKELAHPRPVQRTLQFTPKPEPLRLRGIPPECQEMVARINQAIVAANWLKCLEAAQELESAADLVAALRAAAEARRWFLEVLVAVPVLAGENADGPQALRYFQQAEDNYSHLVMQGFEPSLRADYHRGLALFRLQGGANAPEQWPRARWAETESLLNVLGAIRNTYGREIDANDRMRRLLCVVEGWTVARRLCEPRRWWGARFDATNPDHQRRWERLQEILAQLEQDSQVANDTDVLRLKRFFWEAAGSFCHVPFRDELVIVGSWSAKESRIRAELAALDKRLGTRP